MKRNSRSFLAFWLVLALLFVSCTPAAQTTETPAPQTTVSQTTVSQATVSTTAADPVDVPETEVLTTEAESTSAEEDTSSVPSVPFKLEHAVVDLSEELPDRLLDRGGLYTTQRQINYRNTYIKNGKLYLFNQRVTDDGDEGYLTVFENGKNVGEKIGRAHV